VVCATGAQLRHPGVPVRRDQREGHAAQRDEGELAERGAVPVVLREGDEAERQGRPGGQAGCGHAQQGATAWTAAGSGL
jgi:hypothetical protein